MSFLHALTPARHFGALIWAVLWLLEKVKSLDRISGSIEVIPTKWARYFNAKFILNGPGPVEQWLVKLKSSRSFQKRSLR